jgi:acetyltransferase
MCVAILNHAKSELIGFSKFVSMGNKTNVSGNDLLRDFGSDPNTQIILMYIENFGNPRNTTIIAREISRKKPIICVKSGRTKAGSAAASSHTGAIAGLDAAAEAMFRQTGIMRASSIEELFDYAIAFENQPTPKGRRIAVLTNAGGPGIMTADAIEGLHLEMAHFTEETTEILRKILPEEASVKNPVDMIAGATFEDYRQCLKAIINDKNVDGVIVLNVPLVLTAEIETAETIADVARFSKKPILCCFLGKKEDSPGVRHLTENNVPTYRFPESAVKAMRVMYDYRTWLDKDKGKVREFKVDKDKVRKIIERTRKRGNDWLDQADVREVFKAYGFQVSKTMLARTEEEAVKLAKKMNFPVVLKIDSPDILHKWDTGGVVLDLHTANEVRRAYKQIMKSVKRKAPKAKINGIRVESMIQGGKEVIMGMTYDPTYGPLIMFGLGGIYVEAVKDVTFRLVPLSNVDATEMLSEIKGYRLLEGMRGEKPVDRRKAAEMLERLAQLVTDFHEIAELDMNPVMLMPRGGIVVDGRIKLAGPKEQLYC